MESTAYSLSEPTREFHYIVKFRKAAYAVLFVLFLFCASTSGVFAQDEDDEKDPVALFNEGQTAHEKGDLLKALKLYDEVLKIAPEFPEAEYQRGNALVSLGRNTEAEKSFRRALQLKPDWNLAQSKLGQILAKQRNYAEAEKFLLQALASDAKDFESYPILAQLKIKTGDSPGNLQNFLEKLRAVSMQNSDASIWAARGIIENRLNDKKSAFESLNRALAINSSNIFALNELAEIFISDKKFSEARAIADKLKKLQPGAVSNKLLSARIFAAEGKSSEASAILEMLDKSDPEADSLTQALSLNSTEDISFLENRLSESPKNAVLLGKLCSLTRKMSAKALDYCRRASEAEPDNINHAIGYGAALVQARQFPAAVGILRRLLQVEPDNYTIHANLAAALFETKNYAEAKKEYAWLIEKKPETVIAYYFLAIAHDNLQEYREAQTNYLKFLKSADSKQNSLEIDKVNLRLPILEKQLKKK